MTPGYAQTGVHGSCREDEERSTVPKALCLSRTRDLSFDCLVFLLGCETEICPCLFCFLLLEGCSIKFSYLSPKEAPLACCLLKPVTAAQQ